MQRMLLALGVLATLSLSGIAFAGEEGGGGAGAVKRADP
jgi:hypothetical protein